MKKATLNFKTIILSDIHLGTKNCQASKVNHFLKHSTADRIILNGDIIDGWNLKRQGGWKNEHTCSCGSYSNRSKKKGLR